MHIGEKVFAKRQTGDIREGIVIRLDSRVWVDFSEGSRTRPEAFDPRDVSTSREYFTDPVFPGKLEASIEWAETCSVLTDYVLDAAKRYLLLLRKKNDFCRKCSRGSDLITWEEVLKEIPGVF